ncbi:MAG: hypothetical protein KA035_00850 [Candidatus Levybacteria bacterium]|nr:hypothetical protein [Candidatus Levybacteria bacterium]
MKRTVILVLSLLFGFILLNNAQAASLTNAMLRLDLLKPNSALSGLVCATPASSATEGKVKVTFPSDFSILSSGWGTNTFNLPSGSTAWPGVSYDSQSGTSVTFTSSNLNAGTRYCFNFTATGSTTGALGTKTGNIETQTSGSTLIDSAQYGLTVTNNTTVQVTATVPAVSSDFLATLTKTSPSGTVFPPNQIISYSLAYETLLSYSTDVEVVASWSLGTIEGSLTPSIDILDYVLGSASNGYAGAVPVINTVNRTITWNVTSFPGNTPEAVTFNLETNSAFTSTQQVEFSVNGKLVGPGTESTTSSITGYYQYPVSPITPTSAPGPTSTPGPAAPSPTSTPSSLQFLDVFINSVTSETAQIYAEVSNPATATLYYGTSLNNMNKSLAINTSSSTFLFNLLNLTPNTAYYFKITAQNTNNTTTSDVFTFKTAQVSKAPVIDTSSIIMESNNVFLVDPLTPSAHLAKTVIPTDAIFQIKLKVDESYSVQKIDLFLRNSNVLGANNFSQNVGSNTVMEPVGNNNYVGRLYSGNTPGSYEIYARIFDNFGNIVEQKVLDIKVAKRLSVSSTNNQPIEGARLTLYYYNESERRYVLVSPQAIAIPNPSYSDAYGAFNIVLPAGKYKADIFAFGFEHKEVEFTINSTSEHNYPQILLNPTPFSIFSYITGFYFSARDYVNSATNFILPILESYRFFDLSAFVVLSTCVLLSFFAFLWRFKIHPLSLHHILRHTSPFNSSNFLKLKILGENAKPLSQVTIILEDSNQKTLATHTSQSTGLVYISSIKNSAYITIFKEGYKEVKMSIQEATSNPVIILKNHESEVAKISRGIKHTIFNIFSLFFEVFITISFVTEVLLFLTWSPIKILPFFVISILNIWLWIRIKFDAQSKI